MISNPSYGKSWKSDIKDPRFIVNHRGDPQFKLITRSKDGQFSEAV